MSTDGTAVATLIAPQTAPVRSARAALVAAEIAFMAMLTDEQRRSYLALDDLEQAAHAEALTEAVRELGRHLEPFAAEIAQIAAHVLTEADEDVGRCCASAA